MRNKIIFGFGIFLIIVLNLTFVFSQTYYSNDYWNNGYSNNYNTNSYNSYSSSYNGYYDRQYSSSVYPNNYNPYGNYNNNYYNNPGNYYTSSGGYPTDSYRVYGSSTNPQFYNPNTLNYYNYNSPTTFSSQYQTNCIGNNLIIQIVPGSCTPSIVRSDLLEEQNVPVFCKIMSISGNPGMDFSMLRGVSFSGSYPKGISGLSYFPARVSLTNSYSFQNSMTKSNVNGDLGYLVIVLSQQSSEKDMPSIIYGNITANLQFSNNNLLGIGANSFYLREMSDGEWQSQHNQYGFLNGKGYLRLDSFDSNGAIISVYDENNNPKTKVGLRIGETSNEIPFNGFCSSGFRIKLDGIGAPMDSALLQVNDQQIWVSRGDSIINGMCRVTAIEGSNGGGRVSLSCPSKSLISLSLTAGRASFRFKDNSLKDFAIGDKLFNDKNIYLGYVGYDINNKRFAVLVRDSFSNSRVEFTDKNVFETVNGIGKKDIGLMEVDIRKAVEEQYKKKLVNTAQKALTEGLEVRLVVEGQEAFETVLEQINSNEDMLIGNEGNSLAYEYYQKSIKSYEDLANLYPSEINYEGDDPIAALGLYEAARLSKEFGMNVKAQELYARLSKEYANSNIANIASSEKDLLMKYDTSKAGSSVVVNGEPFFIQLIDIKKPSKTQLSANLLINGKEENLGLNDLRTITNGDVTQIIQVSNIQENYILLKYNKYGNKIQSISRNERLDINGNTQLSLDGLNVRLVNINLDKQARVSIVSGSNYRNNGQTSFPFSIAIDKRAIKLTPEQAQFLSDTLSSIVQKLELISNALGTSIKAMKAACFATSSILTAKNMLAGGESIARNNLMTSTSGWNEVCEKLVNEKKYLTLQECLLDKNSEIEKDVKIYADKLKELKTSSQDSKDSEINTRFREFCDNNNQEVILPDKEKTKISFNSGICNWSSISADQKRDIMMYSDLKNSGGSETLKNVADKKLGEAVLSAKGFEDSNTAKIQSDANTKNYNLGIPITTPVSDSFNVGNIKKISASDLQNPSYKNFKSGRGVMRVIIPSRKSFNGKEFVANSEVSNKEVLVELRELENSRGNFVLPTDGMITSVSGNTLSSNASNSVRDYLSLSGLDKVRMADYKVYNNPIVNPEQLYVKYFEGAPYKGLPSEVPFDVNNGWYAEMISVSSGFGQPYDESGKVVNFYICNVGGNGLIEFKKSSDDICRYYNVYTGADISFPGMSSADSKKLIDNAIQAIAQASKQYGNKKVTINGRIFNSGTSFANGGGKCTDYMSASDCNTIFNACDPVICPSSRCNLGGKYRVNDVVQSGIIGSLTLCLPNAKEGIVVPICLTGVRAGIDGITSILRSAANCLNESVKTGRNIGICDEIKSVYLCEFLWKESNNLMNIAGPSLLQSFYSNPQGGGEYMNIGNAMTNNENSISYFKNQYFSNSINAFNSRSLDNVAASKFCTLFSSSNFSSGSFSNYLGIFDRALEPESPVQYHAWFSEDVMTTATVPATSHYKVYYHIYAGRNYGASYSIYFKDSGSSIYNTNNYNSYGSSGYGSYGSYGMGIGSYGLGGSGGVYVIASGYVAIGSEVDEAKDFMASSGYKQLCINANGKEDCGFGKVSTSYMVNSMSDKYAAEQIKTGITGESECIAGTPIASQNFFNPNPQAAYNAYNNPQVYNYGIIRVCSTENPGKKILANGQFDRTNSSSDRWRDVGYCGDSTIRCWLDTDSVKNVIKDTGIQQQVLNQINLNSFGAISMVGSEESVTILNNAQQFIDSLIVSKEEGSSGIASKISSVENDLRKVSEIGIVNNYRARASLLLGRLYKRVAQSLFSNIGTATKEGVVYGNEGSDYGTSGTTSSSEDSFDEDFFMMWSDDMLNLNVEIRVLITGSKTYSYKYNGKSWDTGDSSFNKNQGYVDGVVEIVKKTKVGDKVIVNKIEIENLESESYGEMAERVFEAINANSGASSGSQAGSTSNSAINSNNINLDSQDTLNSISNYFFEFQDGTAEGNIFYSYRIDDGVLNKYPDASNKYEWHGSISVDVKTNPNTFWIAAKRYKTGVGAFLNIKNQDFMKKLIGKNCNQGLRLLAQRTYDNKEGGWFANTGLYVYNYEGSYKKIEGQNLLDLRDNGDCSKLGLYFQ